MSTQSQRDQLAPSLQRLLNTVFQIRERGASPTSLTGPQGSRTMAATAWLVLEVEAYLAVLTARECRNIKVWKHVAIDGEYDVYLRVRADGRATAEFDLKVYVRFPRPGECRFDLEDWADGTRGFVNGRVVESGGTFQCGRVPTQPRPPEPVDGYYDDDEVPV